MQMLLIWFLQIYESHLKTCTIQVHLAELKETSWPMFQQLFVCLASACSDKTCWRECLIFCSCCCCSFVFFGFCFFISRFCANHRIRFGNFLFFSSINSVAKTADSNLCPNSFFNFTVLWLYLAWNWKAISFGKSCHCRLQKEHFHCRSD